MIFSKKRRIFKGTYHVYPQTYSKIIRILGNLIKIGKIWVQTRENMHLYPLEPAFHLSQIYPKKRTFLMIFSKKRRIFKGTYTNLFKNHPDFR